MVAAAERSPPNVVKTSLRADGTAAAIGALAAAIPALALWGFTVDDALIPARYATHLARGLGYRFNAGGPITDGVTPLGWAYVLTPFAGGGPMAALAFARVFGIVAWVAAAALLAVAIARVSTRPARFAGLVLVVASAPLAAWSGAGLETGAVTAFASLAVTLRAFGRDRTGTLAAGVAAGLRPELLPWAAAIALSSSHPPREGSAEGPWPRVSRLCLTVLPFALAAVIRGVAFGRLAPLSALAKPPDAALGARYAAACFLLTGPVALLSPRAIARVSPFARGLLASVAVHFAAIALAGGDWMPLSRLAVPVLPTVALAAAHVASSVRAEIAWARVALAVLGELFVMVRIGPVAARVAADRRAVLGEIAPVLENAQVIATVDVGWTGAATEATLLDLAGVTDPTIARLPGGHTTKRISADLLDSRAVDTMVLLLADGADLGRPWTRSLFARGVEARIAHLPGMGEAFEPVLVSSRSPLHYLVVRRIATRIEAPVPARPTEPLDPGEPLGL